MERRMILGFLFATLFVGVIIIILVCFTAKPRGASVAKTHPPAMASPHKRPSILSSSNKSESKKKKVPWWQEVVIYQVYPRSFFDKSGRGSGGLRGIRSKAEYLSELGVGAVWLSPIYKSPMKDFGYDISDFTDIDPIFGTMADFNALVNTFHNKGLKVVMDFVPNHSSDQHPWFQKSIKRQDPYTNYYIWAKPKNVLDDGTPVPPNNWKVLTFWLDKGVDGFRVDSLQHLFEVEGECGEHDLSLDEPVASDSDITDPDEYNYLNHTYTINQPETFTVLREWRHLLDKYPDKVLMAEVYNNNVDTVMQYYGNDTVSLADFPFNFLLIDNLQNRSQLTGHTLRSTIGLWLDSMPEGKWPNWVLGNHDNGRVASRLGTDLVDALNMMTLLLPGTPVTYYGEEIGMENTFVSWEDTQDPQGCRWGPQHYQEHSRDPARTPMQWNNSSLAGFTTANTTWLPVNPNYKTLNVEAQTKAKNSHLKIYKDLTKLRKEEVFKKGHYAFPLVTEDIFSFLRYVEESETYMLVINTSEEDLELNLHHGANIELPHTGQVVLRSITDTSVKTEPGSEVDLSKLPLVRGEGLLLLLSL
ncbi:Maltase 2-like [Homarus americanus]|uniref:alpha-glucosidase n=1 Tax=Homarus americanus TaxID=6706 RepID=A0A8J5MM67_HOMAM|nr:Maltase 2-like [Homarus americanus]